MHSSHNFMTFSSDDTTTPPHPNPPRKNTNDVFNSVEQILIQGNTLRTCSFDENVERVTVLMKTEGRPLTANVDLWHGPDNTPQKMVVYLEDGNKRPFRAIVETPDSSNAISIRNMGRLEYPIIAGMEVDQRKVLLEDGTDIVKDKEYRIVQGGAVYTTPFAPLVQSISVSLKTDGRPLNARVELLQGPNNNKQVFDVYTEDGRKRPFNAILESPGVGNVVRIVNKATVEFPLSAAVEPYITKNNNVHQIFGSGMTWSHEPLDKQNKKGLSLGGFKNDSSQKSSDFHKKRLELQPASSVSSLDALSQPFTLSESNKSSLTPSNPKSLEAPVKKEIGSYLDSLSRSSNKETLQTATSYLDSLSSNFHSIQSTKDEESLKSMEPLEKEIASALLSTAESVFSQQARKVQFLRQALVESKARIQERLSDSSIETIRAEGKIENIEKDIMRETNKIQMKLDETIGKAQKDMKEDVDFFLTFLKANIEVYKLRQTELKSLISTVQSSITTRKSEVLRIQSILQQMQLVQSKTKYKSVTTRLDGIMEQKRKVHDIEQKLINDLSTCVKDLEIILEESKQGAKINEYFVDRLVGLDVMQEGAQYEWIDVDAMEMALEKAAEDLTAYEKKVIVMKELVDTAFTTKTNIIGESLGDNSEMSEQ